MKDNSKYIYTLLSLAVMIKDLNNIPRLLDFNLQSFCQEFNITYDIFFKRQNKPKHRVLYFTIIQLLLEANKIPACYIDVKLEQANHYEDEELMFLLKKYRSKVI